METLELIVTGQGDGGKLGSCPETQRWVRGISWREYSLKASVALLRQKPRQGSREEHGGTLGTDLVFCHLFPQS